MRESLQLHLQEKQYRDMLARYHFAEDDLEQLGRVGSMVEQEISPVMYYEMLGQDMVGIGKYIKEVPTERLAVIVTLGSGVDKLQDAYMQNEKLTQGYMTECVSMEFLRIAYEQAAERIHERFGRWMSGFEFVGDRVPFECMEEIFKLLTPQEVSYNEAYMLCPKKTVVFLTGLCEERKDSYCHVCENCSYLACPNRMKGRNLTYGYQRIFGDKG